ncbi:MAG: nucleotidyl transferase AbiEii/AbiGii toxin family protein [Tannerella sp.]|jgi:predicted nucleotidyltransferase component of viral defense system|nr:nucleotidyl transferase AbiEii/AbiGii toxin family protein [Tannerella sp.]
MNLHENKDLFIAIIRDMAQKTSISEVYIEKDYWLTRSLQRLSQNPNAEKVVFKGGTALSKIQLTKRFSEDIDFAVIEVNSFSGNQLKMLIKRLAKDMATDLKERIVEGITSKGSRFYKAIYLYPNILGQEIKTSVKSGQLMIEINTYANPYPYQKHQITSFVSDHLLTLNRQDLIEKYNLSPFTVNVLDKSRTMLEKIVSLLRFSFAKNPKKELAGKIRHFYDLYYLAKDEKCSDYIQSVDFQKDLQELFIHDQQEFNEPTGWQTKMIKDSPLFSDFPDLWSILRETYLSELPMLAFTTIPDEKVIEANFTELIYRSII